MSSRQEEKQKRKAEREAAEAAAARSAARKGRLQLLLGGLVAIVAIVVAVFALQGAGGDGDATNAAAPGGDADIPAQKETNLRAAASAAKCELKTTPADGSNHTSEKVTYTQSPPTSGDHDPVAADDGLYETGNAPPAENHVHSLEHGRINIQYKAGTPQATVDKLETLGSEPLSFGREGYHVLVFENNTEMEPAVAATAWTQSLTCPTMNDGVYDAIRAFRTEYTDKGPELIP